MKRFILLISLIFTAATTAAAKPPTPRLVIQIVVSSMRAADVERYAGNYGEDGFRRLLEEGTIYTGARYNYLQTTTPVGLATLSTGAMPSTHGVACNSWVDYPDNTVIGLVDGPKDAGAYHLIAPTLAEALTQYSPLSRAITIAADPVSAIVTGGHTSDVYWLDDSRCEWTTSRYYAEESPEWIRRINRERPPRSFIETAWHTFYNADRYLNSRHRDITVGARAKKSGKNNPSGHVHPHTDRERLLHTPMGNKAVLNAAKRAVESCKLGTDEHPDLLNICLDASRYITEAYGPESVEVEDMYYRLDRDLADFLNSVMSNAQKGDVVVVVTSDHGSSPSCDIDTSRDRTFDNRQLTMLVTNFLSARYGRGDWVVHTGDKSLWLNHNLIYNRGLTLEEVQKETAVFAMQYKGVSHAMTATAMCSGYFGSGYAEKMQNSFYPRRSGDIVINLMPGWIERHDRRSSLSGSLYGYDTEVPLMVLSTAGPQRIGRSVDMTSVAPTLAHLMGITDPAASDGDVLEEITE